MDEPRNAELCLQGWAGFSATPCLVVGETPKRYRIEATQERMKLAGRSRWLRKGERTLVPRASIRFVQNP